MLNHGLDIEITFKSGYIYGPNSFGPFPEIRHLKDIRQSLSDPDAQGPDELYKIVMDVGQLKDKQAIEERNLLFGIVSYNKGKIGNEPVRSQGHIHAVSPSCGSSTPEVYEIWQGKAIIYMQETADDHPGKCYAVEAGVGDIVIVPPNWAHATISADKDEELIFGAWCVRDYGFEYDDVRKHQGLAWYPIYVDNKLTWLENKNYLESELIIKKPRIYTEFGLDNNSIYRQFQNCNDKFNFVSNPRLVEEWDGFEP